MLKCPHCGKTLVHGSLYAVPFAGERVHHGGWGCYGSEGCGAYLMIQRVLDKALIYAFENKCNLQLNKVEYYLLDNNIEEILLRKDNTVEIRWRDGEVSTESLDIYHLQFDPVSSATRYNAFLEKVRSGKTKVKSKFLLGL